MDIEKFYPTADPTRVAHIARIMLVQSDFAPVDINHEELAMYVAKNVDKKIIEEENLSEVVFTKNVVRKTKKLKKKTKYEKRKPNKNNKKKNENKNIKKNKSEVKIQWVTPLRKPSPQELKIMFGLALERLIKVCLTNHMYLFKNEARLQKEGCATGLDITGLATDLYMIWWDGKFEKALNQAQIKLDVYGRFKDDLDFLTEIIPVGINYKDGNLVNNSGKNQLITDEENTIRIINKIANEVDDMITLTYDIPEKHEDQKLPVLDLKVWVDKTQELLFEFYEKPTKKMKE